MLKNFIYKTKSLITLLILVSLTVACSEGDIIDTDINFSDNNLSLCSTSSNFVFFKLQNSSTESLSVEFTSTTFSPTTPTTTPITITFNGTSNILRYRSFTSSIDPSNYFCTNIPPSTTLISEELTSPTGTATITVTEVSTGVFNTVIVLNDITLENDTRSFRQDILQFGTYNNN